MSESFYITSQITLSIDQQGQLIPTVFIFNFKILIRFRSHCLRFENKNVMRKLWLSN